MNYQSQSADVGNKTTVSIPEDVPGSENWEGNVKVGIVSYDAAGNESDMLLGNGVFDSVPPLAPTNLVID